MEVYSENSMQETRRKGRIEVICGSMFSGKTEELIRRLKRAKFAKQKVEIFKPSLDTRYSEEEVVTHEGQSIASTPLDSSASILLLSSGIDVWALMKHSFLTTDYPTFVSSLLTRCSHHRSRIGYGFSWSAIRPYASIIGHCR